MERRWFHGGGYARWAGMSMGVGWKLPALAAVLWLLALTAWAMAAAGVIKGPWGLATGAVCTALASVVTASILSSRNARRRRAARTRKEQAVETDEATHQATEQPTEEARLHVLELWDRRHDAARVVEGTVENTAEAEASGTYYTDGYAGRTSDRAQREFREILEQALREFREQARRKAEEMAESASDSDDSDVQREAQERAA